LDHTSKKKPDEKHTRENFMATGGVSSGVEKGGRKGKVVWDNHPVVEGEKLLDPGSLGAVTQREGGMEASNGRVFNSQGEEKRAQRGRSEIMRRMENTKCENSIGRGKRRGEKTQAGGSCGGKKKTHEWVF